MTDDEFLMTDRFPGKAAPVSPVPNIDMEQLELPLRFKLTRHELIAAAAAAQANYEQARAARIVAQKVFRDSWGL